MTDKFTDEQIIKALECCSGIGKCLDCPYGNITDCAVQNAKDTIDLINRQKAEIERLKKYYFTHDYHECHNEAVTEFAERFKKKCLKGGIYPVLCKKALEETLKEMTEGE